MFWGLQDFNLRINCVVSMNDGTIKLRRLIVGRSKVVFLVAIGLVKRNASGRFEVFKASI